MSAAGAIALFVSETSVPILGIDWQPNTDYFCFHIEDVPFQLPFTKRSVFSRIACIFDLMGWLAPIVITAKIIMQSPWILRAGMKNFLSTSTIAGRLGCKIFALLV